MAKPDMEVIKEIPGYKVILKAVLKSQIQQLVEQLASTTEEESVILTASVADGTLCHLGSDSGKVFLEDHEDIKSQFLGFCLKRHHKLKQEKERKEAQEREEALARSMQAVTPPRYDGMGGGYMQHRSPRYHSPQQSPHPVALSRVAPGSRMRSPGNRHQPYPMARPARPTLSFDQQGRSPGQGPGPMVTPVRNTKLDGQVIKIEPEDEDEKSNQSANETTNVQSDVKTNISESSQPSSPSIKPSTPSQTQGPSASDNEDARSESSSSTIPNEASDLKFSDTNPAAGLSLDSDLSNILPTDSSVNEPSTSQGNEQGTMEGLDPNISVKLEAFGDSEMDLEITGVELGQNTLTQEQMSSQEWMANVQNVMQGASGSSADMAGQQGYRFQRVMLFMLSDLKKEILSLKSGKRRAENVLDSYEINQVETLEDLKELEVKIKIPEERVKMVKTLSMIGGLTLRDIVKKIMEKLMSNELMSKFNMAGNKQKLSFKASPVCGLVISSVMRSQVTDSYSTNITEHDVTNAIMMCLKYAPDRPGGSGRPCGNVRPIGGGRPCGGDRPSGGGRRKQYD